MTPEADMSEPLLSWLTTKGWTPYVEVFDYSGYRTIDVIATRPRKDRMDDIWCIEMKVSLSHKVICAARGALYVGDYASVCVATWPRKSSIDACRSRRIGVISIRHGGVLEVIEPKRAFNTALTPPQEGRRLDKKSRLLKRLSQMTPGGVAGLPALKGKGPAQDVARRVVRYLAEHGETPWRNIYDAVPNHYCNYASLRRCMLWNKDIHGNPCESRLEKAWANLTEQNTKGREMSLSKALNAEGAACYLGVPIGTLAAWRKSGQGPAFFVCYGSVRYWGADLDAWLDATPEATPVATPVATPEVEADT